MGRIANSAGKQGPDRQRRTHAASRTRAPNETKYVDDNGDGKRVRMVGIANLSPIEQRVFVGYQWFFQPRLQGLLFVCVLASYFTIPVYYI